MLKHAVFLVIALITTSFVSAQTIHRWVDEDGSVHFSEHRPTTTTSEEITVQTPRASSDTGQSNRPAQSANHSGDDNQSTFATSAEHCEQHRRNLEALNQGSEVSLRNPETGNADVLSDEQRNAMMARTKAALEACETRKSLE